MKPYEKVIGISCQQVVDYCLDYLSGTLSRDESSSFDKHLTYCPDCVKFFQTYKKTPEISRNALTVNIPESVKDSVREFLRSRYDK